MKIDIDKNVLLGMFSNDNLLDEMDKRMNGDRDAGPATVPVKLSQQSNIVDIIKKQTEGITTPKLAGVLGREVKTVSSVLCTLRNKGLIRSSPVVGARYLKWYA